MNLVKRILICNNIDDVRRRKALFAHTDQIILLRRRCLRSGNKVIRELAEQLYKIGKPRSSTTVHISMNRICTARQRRISIKHTGDKNNIAAMPVDPRKALRMAHRLLFSK